MGLFNDHFVAEVEGQRIEFEAFLAGLTTLGCALFVDGERVDHVERFGPLPTRFSLRHQAGERAIRVEVTQTLGTSARLFVDERERRFERLA